MIDSKFVQLSNLYDYELLHKICRYCWYNNINSIQQLKESKLFDNDVQYIISIIGEKGFDMEIKCGIHF